MPDTIRIIGLRFNVRHGVRPEEETLIQPFEVDVEIPLDLSRPRSRTSSMTRSTIRESFRLSRMS